MVSKEKKFIFVHIPKTAGTAIQQLLKNYSDDSIFMSDFRWRYYHYMTLQNNDHPELTKHATLKDYSKYYNIEDYFTFTCVRNPWDRLLSWYLFSLRGTNLRKINQRKFRKFIKFRCSDNELNSTQCNYIYPGVNKVMRYENLQVDFCEVCNVIGIPFKVLPIINSSERAFDLQDYYDDRTRDLVGKLFAEDIETFKYTF